MAPKHTILPGRTPEGWEPFPTGAGGGGGLGESQPLPGVVAQGDSFTQDASGSPGNRFQTTAFLRPHGSRACTPVSRETQSSASRLPQQRPGLSWPFGGQPSGASWAP